ncbi:MAG: hypothetical protein HN952_06880 [Candidatus Cloacimonetes bacterium]|nr:hypothetical protein [Candidatus Cloacimonadota bacterium]
MVWVIDLLDSYGSGLLRIICLTVWAIISNKQTESNFSDKIGKYFIDYLALYVVWNLFMIFTNFSGNVYLVFWSLVNILKFIFFIKIIVELFSWEKWIASIVILLLMIPSIFASVFSYMRDDYYPLNTIDFYNKILFLVLSIVILSNILKSESFVQNLKAFFIFSGFVLYFGLHIVGRVLLMYGQDWQFNKMANLVSLFFWLGSTFFIWNIKKSKHLF